MSVLPLYLTLDLYTRLYIYSFPYSYYNSFASIYYLNHYSNPQCLHWRIRSRYNWSSAVDSVPFQFPSFHEGMDVWNSRNVSPL